MRFKRKKDLKEQIRELQSIIHIQGSPSPALRVRPPGWILASSSLGGGGREGKCSRVAFCKWVLQVGCCLWEGLREGPGRLLPSVAPASPLRPPSLPEQGRKLRTQGSEEAVRKNRELIGFLRTTLQGEMHELNRGLKVSALGLPHTPAWPRLALHNREEGRQGGTCFVPSSLSRPVGQVVCSSRLSFSASRSMTMSRSAGPAWTGSG